MMEILAMGGILAVVGVGYVGFKWWRTREIFVRIAVPFSGHATVLPPEEVAQHVVTAVRKAAHWDNISVKAVAYYVDYFTHKVVVYVTACRSKNKDTFLYDIGIILQREGVRYSELLDRSSFK